MAVSSENSGSSLHSPQEQTEQFSTCLAQQFTKAEPPVSCDSFLQPLHHPFLPDFTEPPALQECWDASNPAKAHLLAGAPGPVPGGCETEDRQSARRLHKADREKLRRDKLNEQFSELASVLDPDRPKNDKATILGESVQIVKDLREEVKRLKAEHSSLLDESRDLTQEKSELREEKAALKNETEQLQNQIQQRLKATSPWMAMDPSMMMSATAFPYPPMPVQQPISAPQAESHPVSGPPRAALLTPSPYMPLAPSPLGAFHMHPNFQAFPMFGNRPNDGGGNPYVHYPAYSGQPLSSHSHIERPYAQYPASVQPMPCYVQISPSSGSDSHHSSRSSSAYKACVPGIPVIPISPNHGSCQQSKASSHQSSPSQSSSQHTPQESKQDVARVAEPTYPQMVESVGIQATPTSNVEGKGDTSMMCLGQKDSLAAAPNCAMEKLAPLADKMALFPMVEGETCAGEVGSNSESELAHDSSLRPPAA